MGKPWGWPRRRLTPAYAAPEFFSGQATRWSDQYCLAVTYCQLRGKERLKPPAPPDQVKPPAGALSAPPAGRQPYAGLDSLREMVQQVLVSGADRGIIAQRS